MGSVYTLFENCGKWQGGKTAFSFSRPPCLFAPGTERETAGDRKYLEEKISPLQANEKAYLDILEPLKGTTGRDNSPLFYGITNRVNICDPAKSATLKRDGQAPEKLYQQI